MTNEIARFKEQQFFCEKLFMRIQMYLILPFYAKMKNVTMNKNNSSKNHIQRILV